MNRESLRSSINPNLVRTVEVAPTFRVTVVDDIVSSLDHLSNGWKKVTEAIPEVPREVAFVNLHVKQKYKHRYQCEGGKYLTELVAENPRRFTLLYSPLLRIRDAALLAFKESRILEIEDREKKSILHTLEQNPLVQYLTIPFGKDQMIAAWGRSQRFTQEEARYTSIPKENQTTPGFVMMKRSNLNIGFGRWIHDLRAAVRSNHYAAEPIIEEAKKIFPDIPLDAEAALEFLQAKDRDEVKSIIPPEVRGKIVRGLFIDAVGTLFEDREFTNIRPQIVQKIEKESQRRFVYVWTGGDYDKLVQTMVERDFPQELDWVIPMPKQLFSGMTVEETIDDLSQEQLRTDHAIQTLQHTQI